jgi:DHA1 family tetracycline resistance protein-like MFS transporter
LLKEEKNISVFPILLVNFIGTLGFSVVLPFLVFLVTKFNGNALVYGMLGAAYPFFQLIGGPLLGKWSDIYGRKKILLLSLSGTFIGWIIFFTAFYLPINTLFTISTRITGIFIITIPIFVLFIARAIDGITGGNISVANAYLADITKESERSKNFGKMSVSSNLGFILGPAFAGLLGSTVYGEKIPVLATMFISLVAVFLIIFFLPESKPKEFFENLQNSKVKKVLGCENKECFKPKGLNDISFKKVLSLPGIPFSLFTYFMIFLGFNFFYTAFPIHVVQSLKWTISQTGIFFSVLSLLLVIVEGPLLSYVSKFVPETFLIIAGNIILTSNFILLMSGNIYIIYLAAVLFALGNGLMWPSFLSVLSKIAGEKYQGSVQGFAGSAGSLASIIGLIIGGILYSSIGVFTFLIAGIIIFIVGLTSFRLRKLIVKPIEE